MKTDEPAAIDLHHSICGGDPRRHPFRAGSPKACSRNDNSMRI